jgi:hypothetical protein
MDGTGFRPYGSMRAERIARTVRFMCGCILVSFFLWTAHFALYAPWPIARYATALPDWIIGLSAARPWVDPFVIVDFVCLALLALMVALTLAVGWSSGRVSALVSGARVGSTMMMLLGLAVLVFDPSELWIPVTVTQYYSGLAMWFTNGMDLVASVLVFVVSSCVARIS